MYEFITTFQLKHDFAKLLTESAEKYLLNDTQLVVYCEDDNLPDNSNKIKYVKWNPVEAIQFINKAKPIQEKKISEKTVINSSEYEKNKSWMWHATRFCWKVYAMADHALVCSERYMIWIDSDVEFTSPITEDWLKSLQPEGYYSSYLNRPNRYSETGFISFDTHHPYHQTFWKEMKASYNDLTIFDIDQGWTDCHVYDRTRKNAEKAGVKFFDVVYPECKKELNPSWKHTPLAKHTIHYKGQAKGIII